MLMQMKMPDRKHRNIGLFVVIARITEVRMSGILIYSNDTNNLVFKCVWIKAWGWGLWRGLPLLIKSLFHYATTSSATVEEKITTIHNCGK